MNLIAIQENVLQHANTTLSFGIWAATWQNQQSECAPSEDSDQPQGIRPVWSESSLSAWRKLGSLATHWVQSEDWSDWADAQADLSLHWTHTHFVGFVMSWLTLSFGIYSTAEHLHPTVISANKNFKTNRCSFSVFWEWGRGPLIWEN